MTTLTRRSVLTAAVGAAAALRFGLPSVSAQSSTPAAGAGPFAGLGYPELNVAITDSGYEGIPDSLPAGRYLLTAVAAASSATPAPGQQPPIVAFVSPTPAGMTAADFLQLLAGPPAGASPEAGGGGQGGDQQLPLAIYQMKFAGGVLTVPGESAQSVIDLTAGEWLAWGDNPAATPAPVVFTVTGDFPADVQEPQADITATLVDFAIAIDGALTAGTHVIKVQHHGAQPHFMEIDKGPDSMTKEQVDAALMGQMSGTPAAGGLDESALQPIFYSPAQSIGTTTWHTIDLPAGTLLAACYFPTAGTGVPHAMNGMVDVFKVS